MLLLGLGSVLGLGLRLGFGTGNLNHNDRWRHLVSQRVDGTTDYLFRQSRNGLGRSLSRVDQPQLDPCMADPPHESADEPSAG